MDPKRRAVYNQVINSIIANNKDMIKNENTFCCGTLGNYSVIENEKLQIIFSNESELCEVLRKKNDNPVIMRSKDGEIYRLHGESCYLDKEMWLLGKFQLDNLSETFQYD